MRLTGSAGAVLNCSGEEGAEPEGQAFNSLVNLHSSLHLQS